MDVYNHGKSELEGFGGVCFKKKKHLFISNPSFEVWLPMHFRDVHTQNHQGALEQELSEALCRLYVKSQGIGVDAEMVAKTIERSEARLADFKERNRECLDSCPSATIHFLVKKLLRIDAGRHHKDSRL